MKLRSFFSTLAGVSLLLLIIAVFGLNWIISSSPLSLLSKGGVVANPDAAMFIPRQSPAMVSLLVNPQRLEALRQLEAKPGERRRSRAEINKIKDSLLSDTGLSYRKDIQPWLGDEVTLAVTSLDYDRNENNGSQPGYLLVASIKDGELAREFLQLYFSRQAIAGTSDLVFEQYKGVNLIYRRSLLSPSENTLASAVVGNDYILVANNPRVLKNAINNVQVPDLNLKNAPAYQQALQAITKPRIGVGFVNLPAVAAWINHQPIPDDSDWEQMLTLALTVNRGGFVTETALAGVSADLATRQPALTEPVNALKYVPVKSGITAAGTDLNAFWETISERLAANNPIETLLDSTLASLEEDLGVNLPKDVFSWVNGEYALSLVPNSQRQQLDWVFVSQTTPEAEEAIERLDDLAKEKGLSVGNLPLKDTTITAWTKIVTTEGNNEEPRLEAQVQGVHTRVNDYEVFATSISAINQAISSNTLLKSNKFQKAIAPLPEANDGYFYIDWNQSQSIIEQQIPVLRVVELAGKPFFEHLRSLTVSSLGSENGVRRATIFFDLN